MKNTFEIQNSTADFSDYYSKSSISANTQSKMETIDFFGGSNTIRRSEILFCARNGRFSKILPNRVARTYF